MTVSESLVGQTVSHYRILEKLGSGGMGVVYKAEDVRLRRFVALKFLPEEVGRDSHALARFQREAQAASALNHPNICTIYDVGGDHGRAYITMEYLEGKTLRLLILERRLTTDQILDLGYAITSALNAAHAKGIIHRDIKPANIFVSEEGRAKILDFGLAKITEKYFADEPDMTGATAEGADRDLTLPGAAIGTVAYMSPEQVRGETLDARTDLFSFGAVLYEMATGRLAFPGNTSGIIFDAILNRIPTSAVRIRPELPPRLHEIMSKAMEKDRNLRYQHASEICADLKRLKRDTESRQEVSGVGLKVKSDIKDWKSILDRLSASGWVRKRRTILAILCAVSLLIILTLMLSRPSQVVWTRIFGPALPHQKNLVVLPFTSVNAEPAEQIYCDGFTETVTAKLAQVQSLQVPSALEVRTKHVANIQEAKTQLGANLVLVASWQRIQNSARINLSLVDARTGQQLRTETIDKPATDLFRLQDEVVLKASRMLRLELSPTDAAYLTSHGTTVPSAYDFYIQGVGYLQRPERPENAELAIRLLQRSAEEDPRYAQAQAALAEAYWDKYLATKDPPWAEHAKDAVKKARDIDSQLPEVLLAIGNMERRTGSYREAVSAFQRALELEPENVDAYVGLGKAYDSSGSTREAEQALHRAVDINPNCWNCYNSLGGFLSGHARYGEAAEAWKKVTELTPDNVWGYMNMGAAYFNLGDFAKADEYFRRGLQLAPHNGDLYSNAGTVSFFLGHFQEAATYCLKAIELNPERYEYWGNLADAYRMIPAESRKAAEKYRQAIHLAEIQLRINPADTDVLSSLALYYSRINDPMRARKYLEASLKGKPEDVDLLLNACLVHLEEGDTKDALIWLQRAVKAGYPKEQLVANPELASLHSHPQFDHLAEQAKSYR
jgi:serine/threonine protein kinase/tetratricopeptide (TPR) repeat protein